MRGARRGRRRRRRREWEEVILFHLLCALAFFFSVFIGVVIAIVITGDVIDGGEGVFVSLAFWSGEFMNVYVRTANFFRCTLLAVKRYSRPSRYPRNAVCGERISAPSNVSEGDFGGM